MTTAALIVAAGKGERSGSAVPKQFAPLGGKPLIAHSVDAFRGHPAIGRIAIVVGAGQQRQLEAALGERRADIVAVGGAQRHDSVRAGLEALGLADDVLIHDAARPGLRAAVIDRLLAALATHDGAVPALPVVDTLARDAGGLGDTVERAGLVRVQTPQAFRFDAIMTSHRGWNGGIATDDAQMARAAGFAVATVAGDPALDKITHPDDWARMERLLAPTMTVRTGSGFDVHRFEAGRPLWLGGIAIPHDKGLAGHSDADVALHAITDALLGAVAQGDIGDHFPPSDPQWKGAASDRFLAYAAELVRGRGGRIDHIDLTIICEAPRVGPHREAMRARIADLLQLRSAQVSVKATTTERLGFTGRGEGIAAQAIATVRLPEEENP